MSEWREVKMCDEDDMAVRRSLKASQNAWPVRERFLFMVRE